MISSPAQFLSFASLLDAAKAAALEAPAQKQVPRAVLVAVIEDVLRTARLPSLQKRRQNGSGNHGVYH